ncbi:MAG: polysaccharide biosynthesis protein, partial [Pseudomonadales bacterium]
MSFKRNIVANYVGQFYMTGVSILMVPIYLAYMGAEAYGLVGFFVVLQASFRLLDLGLSPTLAREVARYTGGAISPVSLWQLLRSMEGVFVVIGLLGGAALIASAEWIAQSWLTVKTLPLEEVEVSLLLMSVTV